jgi:glutamate dehydrogenase/leucine dehydrogenase
MADVTELIGARGHEQVVYFADDAVGLRGIIAVHSTALGPSLGGLRIDR